MFRYLSEGLGEAEITAAYAKEAKEPLVCKVTVRRTPAQVQEEIVKPLKLKAVAELNGYKKPADYRDAQKKQLALADRKSTRLNSSHWS